jgi:4-amino-4-deoxy-L-arabinose transferase-like glycosyltransferase
MRFLANFARKYTNLILIFCILIAIGLHVFKLALPCLNADEAAFSYNAYSIAQTARDEYGTFIPFRLTSFGDNKLPVTSYIIAPFVKILGLNELSARLPFILMGVISPLLFYILAKHLFKHKYTALFIAFLAAISPWIQISSRHIHEDTIILTLSLVSLIFLVKLISQFSYRYVSIIALLIGLSFFTYHIGKVLGIYFFVATTFVLYLKRRKQRGHWMKPIAILLIPLCIFAITEFVMPPTRVANLLFFKNEGFQMAIDEKLRENPVRIIHNKVTSSVIMLTHKYLTYFSPEFLVVKGDTNNRFGALGISPITPVEYILFLIGLLYLFKNKHEYRYLILSFLLVSPLSSSLAWPENSLTRSFTEIIPLLLISGYGGVELIREFNQRKFQFLIGSLILGSIIFFVFFTWEFYFYHYFRRPLTAFAWQCGYNDLSVYIEENYDRFDTFYISKKHGQPYIFTLFYLKYSPEKYQKEAKLGPVDEYGFGQVEGYDKFRFDFNDPNEKRTVYIGYPDDFKASGIEESRFKKITYDDEVMFLIYEN